MILRSIFLFSMATAALGAAVSVPSLTAQQIVDRNAAARGLYFRVELLKPDQMLDIRVHLGLRESYQTPRWEGGGRMSDGGGRRSGLLYHRGRAHSSTVRAAGS